MTFSKNYTFKQITNNATLSISLIDTFHVNRDCSTVDKHNMTVGNSVFTSETIVYSGVTNARDKYICMGYSRDKNFKYRIISISVFDRHSETLFNYDSANCDYGTNCPTLLDMYQALFD